MTSTKLVRVKRAIPSIGEGRVRVEERSARKVLPIGLFAACDRGGRRRPWPVRPSSARPNGTRRWPP